MKRTLWYLAGLLSGVGLVLWWGGRLRKLPPMSIEGFWEKWQSADADVPKYYFGDDIEIITYGDSLDETQPIVKRDKDGNIKSIYSRKLNIEFEPISTTGKWMPNTPYAWQLAEWAEESE